MKYKIVLTNQVDHDLRGIYEYIAFNLQSSKNAEDQLNCIELKILGLEEMPNRYKVYEKEPWCSRGLMQMPVDNFVVFYIADSLKATVTVIRVMYGGRDIETQLAQRLKV